MSLDQPWLDVSLEGLSQPRANRVRLFRLLLATAGALRGRFDRALAKDGLTTQQGALLSVVESRPSPPALGDVARAMGMTHQNARQIVAALERKGLIDFVPDEEDRRVRRLVVTKKHKRLWKDRNPGDFELVEGWTRRLGDDDVRTMVDLLRRLHADAAVSGA